MKKIIFVLLLIPFTIRAQIITTVAGSGPYIYSGDGGLATLATLDPQCVFVDGSENIYIADNYNSSLHLVNSAGIIRTIAGTEVGGFSGDGGPATAAMMYNALAVTLDATGNIFVVDQTNQRIRRINTAGIISTFAGNGFGALTGSGGFSGDGGQATAAELNNPYGVAVDASGNVYIADGGNNRIRKVNSAGIISTFAGNGTAGFSGDGLAATSAQLNIPISVATDAAGNVYIVDNGDNRIRKVNSSGIITTIAGNGIAGYFGDGGPATACEFHSPSYITVSASGNIYIADVLNECIRKINPAGIITTFAGSGTSGFSGDGGPATLAKLFSPCGISVDGVENVYFADESNHRVRKISGIVSGSTILCQGSTTTFEDAVTAGAWTSSNPAVATVGLSTGIVSGVSAGTATLTFTGSGGYATAIITINPLPNPGVIIGGSNGCPGASIMLSDTVTGGIWTVTNTYAVITAGNVTCITAGVDTIKYSVSNSCGTTAASKIITINPIVSAGIITGLDTVCIGHTITLSDTVSGGIWSAAGGHASVSASGVVTGVTAGWDSIIYTVANFCDTSVAVYSIVVDSGSFCVPMSTPYTITLSDEITLYPNPNRGDFTIYIPSGIEEETQMAVVDLLGRKVLDFAVFTNKEKAIKTELQAGIYFISVTTEHSKSFTKLFVVR